jgi:aryl-alcohol dehydrogenase
VGLSGLMAAKIAGCDPIIAVDIHNRRLDLAREPRAVRSRCWHTRPVGAHKSRPIRPWPRSMYMEK